MYYSARIALSGHPSDPIAAWVESIPADAYEDRSWLMTGFHELHGPPEETGLGGPAGIRWEPFTYWRYRPHLGQYVNLDANGLRRTWNMPTDQPVKVSMFGGSTMWGVGARDEFTIASMLSKMLAQVFPSRVQIANYGTTGYVSTQEMIFLLRELQQGQRPDIVIFYDGYNDTFSAYQSQVAGVTLNEHNRAAEFNLLRPTRTRALFLEVLKRSNLYNLMEGISTKAVGGKAPCDAVAGSSKTNNRRCVERLHGK